MAGKKEGRDNGLHPGEELFFADGYLEMYPDVAKAGQDPWRHYLLAGKKEGRDNGEHPGEDIFSAEGYLKKYPDVKEAHLDPWHHYVTSGKKEGRGTGKSKVIDWPSAQHLFSRNVLVIADPSMQQHALFRADQKKSALENYGYKVSVISIADRDRNPVHLLADGVIATMMEPVELPEMMSEEKVAEIKESKRN